MTQTTSLWNLPVWAVLVIVLIVAVALFNIVNSITLIWREPKWVKPEKITPEHNPFTEGKRARSDG
jgi:hypothetical protein